ncbi:MAG: alpha/beta hydrolase family protein [Betaproteobacteria bacterium]
MAWLHSIRATAASALVLLAAAGGFAADLARPATASAGQPAPPPEPTESSFTVFVRAVPIGSEQIGVVRDADGWTITSSGRLGAPIDVVARRVQVRYDPDWKPIEVTVDATVRGQTVALDTTVSGGKATSRYTVGTQTSSKTDTIAADALLVPSPFWGPFEALSLRLKDAAAGSVMHAYAAPQAAFDIEVGASTEEKIQTADRLITVRRTSIRMMTPGTPLDAVVWGDENGRLLRLSIPAQNVDVAREDIASVAARRVTISRPNDEQVTVPGDGFSLAGTISRPLDAGTKRLPAIVLVGGSGPTDRDETVFDVPIFAQLAGSLADAGFLVLRYDKRGVGQSGGRPESATLSDYATDLRAVIKYLDDRKDVDQAHVAVVGHSEGGSVAMLAASKDKRIDALVLVSTIGVTGAELNMEQVQHALDRSNKSPGDRQATIELQKRIQHAVLTGSGWEGIPPALRQQAETPWFQSFLQFDPARVMDDVRQPILIVQGLLDSQVPPDNADKLAALADARKKAPKAMVVKVPGVNHLLVPATTGEVDEYGSLKDKRVSPDVASAIISWLRTTFAGTAK